MDAERPHTPFAIKALWWIVGITLMSPLVIAALGPILFAILSALHDREWLNEMNAAYENTAVGDFWNKVEGAFGSPAHYTCQFGEFQVHYFIDPTHYNLHPDAPFLGLPFVDTKDEIPVMEGAKQYLVKDGDVIARIWIGEESYVETIEGRIEANSIRDLPDEFFERHGDQ